MSDIPEDVRKLVDGLPWDHLTTFDEFAIAAIMADRRSRDTEGVSGKPCPHCGSRWAEHGPWTATPKWLRWIGFGRFRRLHISQRADLVSDFWEYSDAPIPD